MENITYQTKVEHLFDAFCKTVIRNAGADAIREKIQHMKKEILFSEISDLPLQVTNMEDQFIEDQYTYSVGDIKVVVSNADIGYNLQFLTPDKRNVILLSFIAGMSDTQIARILNISNKTVAYRKEAGIRQLRELVECNGAEQ